MIKFFNSNRITIKAEPSQWFDNSATTPTPVEPSKPQHPYGTPNHTLDFRVDNGSNIKHYTNLQPNTPEWTNADNHIKNHFGGKIGLDDLAKTYSLPKLKNQHLSIGTTNDYNIPGIGVFYRGNTTDDPDNIDKAFNFELEHGFDKENNHEVNWGSMRNYDKTAPHLMNLIAQSLPTYQKAGIKGITTDAVSSNRFMNGAHTWANLGFGFKYPSERDNVQRNLMNLTKDFEKQGIPVDSLREQIMNSTHPFELQGVARKLAVLNKQLPQKKVTDIWGREIPTKRPDAHKIWADMLEDNSFTGRLSADPNDKGHQRMLSFLKHMRGKNAGLEA